MKFKILQNQNFEIRTKKLLDILKTDDGKKKL